MDAAQLSERIVIQHAEPTVDAIGNRRSAWRDFYSCHALVTDTGGQETDAAGTTVDHADATFLVRWCRAAAMVNSTAYRIVHRDALYDIQSVDHMSYRRRYIKIKGRRVQRT